MHIPKEIIYDGLVFRLQSSGRYYQSDRKTVIERLLHRYVWCEERGPIPIGYHIHHVDGDFTNNHIDNLECIHGSDHQRKHLREKLKDKNYENYLHSLLPQAREAAKAWHGSEEGREWHSKNAKATWLKKDPRNIICHVCGKTFQTKYSGKTLYCSGACSQVNARIKYRVTRQCLKCGKSYETGKYSKQRFCSTRCSRLKS